MDKLLTIKPTSWCCYIFIVICGALAVRFVIAFSKACESQSINNFFRVFAGTGYKEKACNPPIAADYWLGFLIGVIELLSYPILFLSNHETFIGAWLAFKTVNRWEYAPGYKRGHFNRYLIANALILLISYFLAKYMFNLDN